MPGKVLILDHYSPWSHFVAKALTVHGYTSITLRRRGGVMAALKKAVRQGKEKEYDLIIVDPLSDRTADNMVKPLEVAKTIAMHFPSLPLIVASSRPTPDEAVLAYEIGASAYMAKTFDEDGLIECVRRAIHRSHSRG